MATKRARSVGTFKQTVNVELIQPNFEMFQSLADLDIKKLEAAKQASVEIGMLSGGCCRQLVRATVAKGKVTGIEIEPCPSETKRDKKPPADLEEAIRAAAKVAFKTKRPTRPKPFPVTQLARQAGSITIQSITCYRFCLWGYCITCCSTVSGQIVCTLGDVIIHGPIVIVF